MDIKNYLILLLSLFIFFVTGNIIFRLSGIKNPSNKYFKLFVELLTGTIAIVFIYSLIVTKGKTINLLFILIGIITWYLLKKENVFAKRMSLFHNKINKNDLLIIIETIIIATGWYLWTDHYYWNSPYTLASKDIIFYAKVAEYLNMTHYENFFHILNLFDTKYHGNSPYHYFELWLTAAYSRIFNVLELIAYIKLTITVLLTITSVGIIAIFKNYFSHNYFNLFVPLLLFTQGIYISGFLTEIDAFILNPVTYPKYLTIYPMIITSLFLYIKRRSFFFIPLLCIPVVSISCATGIFSGLVLFAIINMIFKNRIVSNKTSLIIILSAFVVAGAIGGFYSLTGIKEKNVLDTMNINYILNNLRTSINIFGATVLQLLYLNIIYIVVFFFAVFLMKANFFSGVKKWWLLAMLVFVTSLAAWALLFQMRHSLQVFQNISIPFINITIIFLFILLVYELKKNKSILYLFLMLVMLVNCSLVLGRNYKNNVVFDTSPYYYSDTFISQIDNIIDATVINPIGVFFFDKSEYDELPGRKESNFYNLGDYLKVLKPNYNTISLTVFDIPLGNESSLEYMSNRQLLESSVFYRFVQNLENENKFTSVEDAQVAFIKTNKINYGIASSITKLSSQLQQLISREVVDEKSGERFMIFSY